MAHQVSGKGLAVSRVLVASLLTSHPMRSLPPPSALKVRLHMRHSKSRAGFKKTSLICFFGIYGVLTLWQN